MRVFHACPDHMHVYNDSGFLSARVEEHFICCSVIMGGSGVIVGVQRKLLVSNFGTQCRIYQLLMQFITTLLSSVTPPFSLSVSSGKL